jgi:hypothetical protein
VKNEDGGACNPSEERQLHITRDELSAPTCRQESHLIFITHRPSILPRVWSVWQTFENSFQADRFIDGCSFQNKRVGLPTWIPGPLPNGPERRLQASHWNPSLRTSASKAINEYDSLRTCLDSVHLSNEQNLNKKLCSFIKHVKLV